MKMLHGVDPYQYLGGEGASRPRGKGVEWKDFAAKLVHGHLQVS